MQLLVFNERDGHVKAMAVDTAVMAGRLRPMLALTVIT